MNTKNPNGPIGMKSQKSVSRFTKVIPSNAYVPTLKNMSRRDKHRLDVQLKKGNV